MKYIIKFLALTALAGAVVYTFFVLPEVSCYGFWHWVLAVSVSVVTIGNYASLIAACTTDDDEETEKGFLILSSFLSFLAFAAIYFFSTSGSYIGWTYLLCCFIVYMLSSGFNRRTWSFFFLGFTQTIFFSTDWILMNTWHSWGIYILLTIAHIICIVVVICDHMDSEPVPKIDLAGLLIPVVVICYLWETNNEVLAYDINSICLLSYLIVALFASIRDDTSTYISTSMASVVYLFFLPNNYCNIIMLIIGCSTLLAGISHYLYKSRMKTILAYAMGENEQMIAKYNNLVENYNQAVDYIKNIRNQFDRSPRGNDEPPRGNEESSFRKGMASGFGSSLVKEGIEILATILGG